MNDSLHWYRPTTYRGLTLDEIAAMLAPYGVTRRGPIGRVLYYRDEDSQLLLKEMGDIVVRQNGRIEVWPYNGATEQDLRILYGSAEEAFRNKPTVAAGWCYKRLTGAGRSYWRTRVIVPVSPYDEVAVLVARAELSDEEVNERACDRQQAAS